MVDSLHKIDSLLELALDQRDCFAAHYLSLHRQLCNGQLQQARNNLPEEDTSRLNLLDIMTKENELLRSKDHAWSREAGKLRDANKELKLALADRDHIMQGMQQ